MLARMMLGFEGEWIVRSYIGWRRERVPARTLALKGVDCETLHRLEIERSHVDWRRERVPARTCGNPTSVGERNKTLFTRVWKSLPKHSVLKTLKGSLKKKVQRRQYLMTVGLNGCRLSMLRFIGSECPTLVNLVEDRKFISEEY